ncbi:MAG: arginase family protein, partial [Gemmatimonadota bacterium]|nr:arginase family protein [Gemmatimonadota bacterium]
GDASRAMTELEDACNRILDAAAGRRVIMIGGEHAVSAPAILAHADRTPERLTVLQLDAHLDLRASLDGSPFSHACAMGRVVDRIDLVTVGARGISGEEWEAASARGNVTVITGEELAGAGDSPVRGGSSPRGETWLERVMAALGEQVYITFDVDFFDPSMMPSTGTPEPGGGTWRQATALLRRVFAERRVVGADVVELAPVPGLAAPDFTAAKLVYKMIGYWSG